MKPDDRPTEARLFPLEANATADMDAKALDAVVLAIREWVTPPTTGRTSLECIQKIRAAVCDTGRAV